jgi:hypothetical protein
MRKLIVVSVIFDGRNITPEHLRALGFTYYSSDASSSILVIGGAGYIGSHGESVASLGRDVVVTTRRDIAPRWAPLRSWRRHGDVDLTQRTLRRAR